MKFEDWVEQIIPVAFRSCFATYPSLGYRVVVQTKYTVEISDAITWFNEAYPDSCYMGVWGENNAAWWCFKNEEDAFYFTIEYKLKYGACYEIID